ncbi:MBL fold metallo-hydrolase [Aggregicoccus sp. 17bor-14]|nr:MULTISPECIES: ComEC/Rec2 family competence protein [Myxococcaceae]MBF5044302.1 MBL fold metallo-hydrolase [Simulacricoccus sp. 17bor-14]MRI90051.1 MBL fold metallo-hydrolase [Aggregicoccus sp. 17bor-14]
MAPSRLLSLLCALLLAGSAAASGPLAAAAPATPPPPPLTVHFFDVGQGDAALIVSPSGKTVLIDGGPPEAGPALARRLKELVKGPLDLVILTHPHLDHLGGLPDALEAVGARRYMDPGFDHPSRAYRDLLTLVGARVGQVLTPTPDPLHPEVPVQVGLGAGVSLSILWPRVPVEPFLAHTRSDANSNSIVVRLTYGRTAMLLVGDAEKDTEERLLAEHRDLSAALLKVAHHGGGYSSTVPFLEAVRPRFAVISCGAGNDYGHPSPETLARLRAVGAEVLRTDLQGEVTAQSDGTQLTVSAARPPSAAPAPPARAASAPAPATAAPATTVPSAKAPYVGLKGSPVFHRADCPSLAHASTKGRTYYPTREAAARERRPAKDCHP